MSILLTNSPELHPSVTGLSLIVDGKIDVNEPSFKITYLAITSRIDEKRF